jgi:hypothetical protein
MKFYLDCEFDGWMGPLISLALVSEYGNEFYWFDRPKRDYIRDEWVGDNVLPILECEGAKATWAGDLAEGLEHFLAQAAAQTNAHIIVDWPDDVAYFCRAMITGPGTRINTPPLTFEVTRFDAYPSALPGAVQHNALWDARALQHCIQKAVRE